MKQREIKFRAWDIQKRKFIPNFTYAIISDTDFNAFGIMLKDWEDYKEGEYFYSTAQSIMQYTGLKDKNGKEIYEGDVVRILKELVTGITNHRYRKESWIRNIKDKSELISKVVFEDGKFKFKNMSFKILESKYRHQNRDVNKYSLNTDIHINCEIIGNIHENPELI